MKIAVITGASSGLGREFARFADNMGFDEIWAVARREERLTELKNELKTPVRPISADLTKAEGTDKIKAILDTEKPSVGLLVNASGFGKYGTYKDLTERENEDMIDLNVKALVRMTYDVLPFMEKGAGIINMGSASSFQPLPCFNIYASTKAFVVHFSRALNVELKEREITVTCVCPGYVRTEFIDVAKKTKNPDACTNFSPLYEAKDVVRKAMRDNSRGRDMSVLGFVTNFRRILARISPAKLTFAIWMKIK